MDTKYIKTRSLAWWASFAPLLGGLVLSMSEVVPQLEPVAVVIRHMAGEMTAAQLIQLGLLGIGLRGAIR